MTESEFNSWLHDFAHAFPQTREWIKQLPDTKATLTIWRNVFGDVTADEVAFVTMKLAAGDLPAIAAYEREQTAATIRRHVLDNRHRQQRRNDGLSEAELYQASGKRPGFSCGESLAGLLKDIAAGVPKAEAVATWLPETDPQSGPRYRCLPCRDSGLRKVWAVRAMQSAKQGGLTRRNGYTAVVRCDCQRGQDKCRERLPLWDSRKWCEFGRGDWEAEAENLREFMADYAANSAERMANYEDSFANY